jgi:predicted RecB family nuclease
MDTEGDGEGIDSRTWQLLNQGSATVDSIARPTQSKVGNMAGAEERIGQKMRMQLTPLQYA